MEPTRTESLLRQALDICRTVTGRQDVSDDLLTEAFRSLQLEQDLTLDDEDTLDDAPPLIRH